MTTTSAPPPEPKTRDAWQRELNTQLAQIGKDSAALAACRRGLGKPPTTVESMWPYAAPVLDHVPEDHYQREAIEAGVHHALTLYAFHQQPAYEHRGKAIGDRMHTRTRDSAPPATLGRACHRLAQALERRDRTAQGVQRRFFAAVTAESVDELIGHIRGLIPMLREHKIPLDYVQFAHDLTNWSRPAGRAYVRRRWGLDFHTTTSESKE